MDTTRRVQRARWRLLVQLVRILEPFVAALGVAWLGILVVDLTRGPNPALGWAERAIWGVFLVEFAAEFVLAPRKLLYLRRNWLVLVSLALPAVRVARLVRLARVTRATRAVRELQLVRTLGALNRAIGALRATMRRRGLAYVTLTTIAVTFGGAAGMYSFERSVPGVAGLHGYGDAVWWTAMIMTTMGSEYWPRTAEGRILCVVLALYAFAVFGYVTATLASYFIDRDAARDDTAMPSARELAGLRRDIEVLRQLVEARRGSGE